MPQDNQLSPLFGHMQDTPPGDATPAPQEVSDKTSTILEGLSAAPAVPESPPVSGSPFGTPAASTPTAPTLPEVSPEVIPTPSTPESLFGTPTPGVSETPSTVPVSLPEVQPEVPTLPEVSPAPVVETPPVKNTPLEEDEDRDIPLRIIPMTPRIPSETPEEKSTVSSSIEKEKKPATDDSKLAEYLRADKVYQEMVREESPEKIRLQIALRYTLLMFAIFLVFAWIVSNRIIMFGFSEFVWLARIRDLLFAVMAGLFGLTLWFGSVSWTHNTTLISVIRTLAVVFFGAVIIALYIPL